MNVYGKDIIDDANNLFGYTNSISKKDFELEKEKK